MNISLNEERDILSEYWHADLKVSIDMFLQYRELRPFFAKIDRQKNSRPSCETSGTLNPPNLR
ncbi:MAG: hypothetical protein C4519_27840 [Desulfobacteraceae bacterium]|nr:MAG: hypothetical protein C4519_27840 [Desulfobacteraceae bacterium]